MRNLRPIGIPHSIFLENLFARTYDASKLEEDSERVRQAYRDHGYFKASVGEPLTHIRNEGGTLAAYLPPKQGQASSTSLCPSKKASATAWAASPSPATST